MTKEIMIGDVPVKFTGNAATTYRYKQLFQRDILKSFMAQGTDIDTDMIMELAYVMHLQAEGAGNEAFNKSSFESYLAWLDGLDFVEMLTAAPEILSIWADTSKQASASKKN